MPLSNTRKWFVTVLQLGNTWNVTEKQTKMGIRTSSLFIKIELETYYTRKLWNKNTSLIRMMNMYKISNLVNPAMVQQIMLWYNSPISLMSTVMTQKHSVIHTVIQKYYLQLSLYDNTVYYNTSHQTPMI